MSTGSGSVRASLFPGEKKVLAGIAYSNKNAMTISHDIETEEDLKKATDYNMNKHILYQLR